MFPPASRARTVNTCVPGAMCRTRAEVDPAVATTWPSISTSYQSAQRSVDRVHASDTLDGVVAVTRKPGRRRRRRHVARRGRRQRSGHARLVAGRVDRVHAVGLRVVRHQPRDRLHRRVTRVIRARARPRRRGSSRSCRSRRSRRASPSPRLRRRPVTRSGSDGGTVSRGGLAAAAAGTNSASTIAHRTSFIGASPPIGNRPGIRAAHSEGSNQRVWKPAKFSGSSSCTSTDETEECPGPSRTNEIIASTAAVSPSKTIATVPSGSLDAHPATPRLSRLPAHRVAEEDSLDMTAGHHSTTYVSHVGTVDK